MKIDFGIVKKYFTDRGFGFVGHTFHNIPSKEVFFHIKKIKRTDPELARKLDNDDFTEAVYFWYEIKTSNKGEEVLSVLNPNDIQQEYKSELPILIERIEHIWKDVNSIMPNWINQVSVDLMGVNRANELSNERDTLESRREEKNEKNEKKRIEIEALQKIEEANFKKKIAEKLSQQEIEDNEFNQLIEEMSFLGFTSSRQVSSYIMTNKLGYKYKNISGIVKMEREGNTWDFKGGFPANIYARICSNLGLSNEGSRARVVDFNSFKKLGEQA